MNIVGTTARTVPVALDLGYIARMRFRVLVVSLMLLAAACGGTDVAPTTTSGPSATTGTTESATAGSGSTAAPDSTESPDSSAAPTTEALRAEGPIAPSFVTTLSDGTQFSLEEHDRPVYLVFWAEW